MEERELPVRICSLSKTRQAIGHLAGAPVVRLTVGVRYSREGFRSLGTETAIRALREYAPFNYLTVSLSGRISNRDRQELFGLLNACLNSESSTSLANVLGIKGVVLEFPEAEVGTARWLLRPLADFLFLCLDTQAKNCNASFWKKVQFLRPLRDSVAVRCCCREAAQAAINAAASIGVPCPVYFYQQDEEPLWLLARLPNDFSHDFRFGGRLPNVFTVEQKERQDLLGA